MQNISGQIRYLYVTWCQIRDRIIILHVRPKTAVLLKSLMYSGKCYGVKMCLEDFSASPWSGVGEYPLFSVFYVIKILGR